MQDGVKTYTRAACHRRQTWERLPPAVGAVLPPAAAEAPAVGAGCSHCLPFSNPSSCVPLVASAFRFSRKRCKLQTITVGVWGLSSSL